MIGAGLGFAASARASGTTFTVAGFADGNGACSPTSPNAWVCPTLRAAASAATSGDTIQLAPGTYQLTLGQLQTGPVTIQGAGPGGAGGTTIQQTDGKDRVLEVQAGPATLVGLEITGGHLAPTSWTSCASEAWAGGGIDAQAPLALQDVLVSGNQVVAPTGPAGSVGACAEGGGVAYTGSGAAQSVIENSTISGNFAVGGAGGTGAGRGGTASGGGLFVGAGATPVLVEDSTIAENAVTGGRGGNSVGPGGTGGAAQGGGIANVGTVTVATATIASNSATGGAQGSGAAPGGGGSVAQGGGLFAAGDSQVVNSTIFGNGAGTSIAGSSGVGGGIAVSGAAAGLSLQSDTIDANSASSADGSLHSPAATPPATIHDTVVSGGFPNNCGIASPAASESYNLEDDPSDTCGFGAANHDLVGANPALPPSPGNNGGPTATLAPAPGSPVLGAGGTCAVSVDQRGEPRAAPCDIGSFQAQRPANSALPTVQGRVARGQTLICDQGAWSGDGTLSYGFAWLRNGVVIAGTATNTYVVGTADAGQTLACRVTATYYGSVSVASPFVIVASYPVITVLAVSANSTQITVSLGCRGPDGTGCKGEAVATVAEKRRGGTVVGFSSSAGSQVVTVGTHKYSITARHTATFHIVLSHEVAHWLNRFKAVPARLSVNQTTAAQSATVATRHLKIHRPKGSRRG